jgi:hypothetical protein
MHVFCAPTARPFEGVEDFVRLQAHKIFHTLKKGSLASQIR